jgi:uncharacterized protein YdeI (YjbR/CyaY-like superfamily)
MGEGEPRYHAKDRAAWRRWLQRNHDEREVVHLVFYRKATGKPCPTYDEAVREALCFGWVDGIKRKIDDERYSYRFTPRRAKSKWSETNKRRVAELEAEGKMRPAGRAAVAEAKRNGAWHAPPRADGKKTPPELAAALRRSKKARSLYDALAPSHRKQWNLWVAEAKKPETRERRAAKALEALPRGAKRPDG